MRINQYFWTASGSWETLRDEEANANAQLVFVFGGRDVLASTSWLSYLEEKCPNAHILSGSTAGEIADEEVYDDSIIATAVYFEHTEIALAQVDIGSNSSFEAAQLLIKKLPLEDLSHIFVLSDGVKVNGTSLIEGMVDMLPDKVSITGGLAGDGARFEKTLVGLNGPPTAGQICAVGFYGTRLRLGYGSVGGWDPFGPDRTVTKSEANVLYELDGKPALELYKTYLGDKASQLPSSALLFPLSMRQNIDDEDEVVRTILSVDETTQSMTFAGDIPEGALVRLMKANFDRLVDGAHRAASNSKEIIGSFEPQLSLLISCVGRKLVLGQRVEDEIESVRSVVGDKSALAGFYSYGEIAPGRNRFNCRLHNQTMTITLMAEE